MKALQLITVCLLASLPIIVPPANATSSLAQKLIVRRQSGETEKENTNNSNNNNNGADGSSSMQAGRLYPDLPQQQPGPVAPMYPGYPNFHGAPTPFVPFSPQLSPSQLSDLQRRMQQQMPMQRPMSAAERLQSQSFTNGLGRRLLAMIGLDTQPEAAGAANESSPRQDQSSSSSMDQSAMRALQNATVLQQLNGGVQSIYGSLSKMYNATVQQQLNLLQERFKKEAENSSAAAGVNNPWQQRIAQQVPMFFKNMASKVGEAQENLNRIMAQMMAQASGNSSSVVGSMPASSERSASTAAAANNQGFFNSFYNQFMNPNAMNPDGMPPAGGNFFDQFGRSLGFSGPQQRAGPEGQAGQDLGSQLMSFWHNQVQPQIGMVRGQVARVWRELMASGALAPAESFVARSRSQLGLGSPAPNSESSSSAPSSELVDEILKEVDMANADFAILNSSAPANGDSANQQQRPNSLSAQMQGRLISAQRELNQLWGGLTNSLQNAIGNVRNTLNPAAARQQSPFGAPLRPMASTNQESKQDADPEENEISGKVKDLSKLQREADTVHDVLKQQQQRPGFGDRFRSFFNNVDLANEFNQLQGRLGTAVGDLWNQIPRRWDMMMESMGPQSEMARARLMAATASPSRSSSTTTQKPDTEATTSSN